ncbi:MAG: tRNA (adenosine(37)-N6)-threonylcarbamoyltransferase complex dimerization subunit type 1 TsaB [Gammaproteobacteria bacterium]
MKILAIETSSDACSAALWHDGQNEEQYRLAPMQHTELLLPMIEALLSAAKISLTQLDALAFGCGPGSFTGLRIAASVVQALGFTLNLPVVPVSTLQTTAQGAYREWGAKNILVAFDARRGEIYWGVYRLMDGFMQAVIPDHLSAASQIPVIDETVLWLGVGDAWEIYADLSPALAEKLSQIEANFKPHARDVAELAKTLFAAGKYVTAEHALPVYLRDANLWKKS